jgi:hypothetical protein
LPHHWQGKRPRALLFFALKAFGKMGQSALPGQFQSGQPFDYGIATLWRYSIDQQKTVPTRTIF